MRGLALLASSAVALAACSSSSAAQGAEWLAAVAGEVTVEERDDGTYLLLSDPSEALLFTDRPFHRRLDVGPETIVGAWSLLGFGQVPPNAAISVESGAPVFTVLADPAWTSDGAIRWRVAGGELPAQGSAAVLIDDGAINDEIVDSVTQANVQVVGEAPAQSIGAIYQAMSQSISLSMANAEQSSSDLTQIGSTITDQARQVISQSDGQGVPGSGTPVD